MLELNRSERFLIQLGLLAKGLDPEVSDGWFGDRTRTAIRHWQAARGKDATGYLDIESARLLMASGKEREAEEIKESRRSQASEIETAVVFVNNMSERVAVYWIDYEGNEIHYRDLEPGQRYSQDTYATHPWVVRTIDGHRLVGWVLGRVDGQRLVIDGIVRRVVCGG